MQYDWPSDSNTHVTGFIMDFNALASLLFRKPIARSTKRPYFQGKGSSHVVSSRAAVPVHELQIWANRAELTCTEGYPAENSLRQQRIDEAVITAEGTDVAVLVIALPDFKEYVGSDRAADSPDSLG